MPSNIKDVANALRVSVSTVSRVINNQGRVSAKTREQVLLAMEKMDYHPNEAARSLREKRSKTIGIIVPDIGNEYFARIIKGADSIAWQEDFALLVMNSNSEVERERRALRILLDKRVAAIVLASVDEDCPFYQDAVRLGIAVVFIDNLPRIKASFDSVTVDNRIQAYSMTRCLIDAGHTRIAMINGSLSETTAEQRMLGYAQAMDEAGLEKITRNGSFAREHGRDSMRALINETNPPTAIFAASNHLAYGVIDALREANLTIPDNISMVCFDTPDNTGLFLPKLSTVNQPAERIGSTAINIIMRRLTGKNEGVNERLYLQAEVVMGNSVAPPASQIATSQSPPK
ncbi:LacI family transcriptional regulator [Clostridia bacterium]|nr:LacI family transcriptional regulator [Clostridia bacterium]